MTLVGKVLAFLNLVFSLLVCGLVAMVYANRTTTAGAIKQRDADVVALATNRDQFVKTVETERVEHSKEKTSWNTKEKEYKDQLDKLNGDVRAMDERLKKGRIGELEEQVKALELSLKGSNEAVAIAQGTSRNLEKEVKEQRVFRDEARAEILKQDQTVANERAKRVQAEADRRIFEARAGDLEKKNKELILELARGKTSPTDTVASRKTGERNPPPDNVEGRIRTVNLTDNLLTLNIGSDDGLKVGHTLEVFRLDPIPERSRYLGTVRILSVRPHEAVAQPLKKLSATPQTDDRVAGKIQVGS